MSPRTNCPFLLAILTIVTVGCANPWRTATSQRPGKLSVEVEPTDPSPVQTVSDQSESTRSSDQMLDEIARRRNWSLEQYSAAKRAMQRTSVDLSPAQQKQFLHMLEAFAPPAIAARATAATPVVRPDPAPSSREREAPSSAVAAPQKEPSVHMVTDASESSADNGDEPAFTAAHLGDRAVLTRLVTHEEAVPAPATTLDRDVEEPKSVGDESFQPGQWKESTSTSIEQLEKELVWGEVDDKQRVRLETYLRLLYVIDNRRDEAVAPIKQLSGDERAFWKHQLYGLAVSLDSEDRHVLSRRAALALREFRTASDHLANISSLDLRNLAFCPDVQSYGRYEEFKPYTFDPDQEVIVYVEVENFAAEEKNGEYETELQGEYTILDSAGQRVVNRGLPLDKQTCKNRRRDYFIAYRINLPTEIAGGEYTFILTMEDVKGHKSNQGSLEFRIR